MEHPNTNKGPVPPISHFSPLLCCLLFPRSVNVLLLLLSFDSKEPCKAEYFFTVYKEVEN